MTKERGQKVLSDANRENDGKAVSPNKMFAILKRISRRDNMNDKER